MSAMGRAYCSQCLAQSQSTTRTNRRALKPAICRKVLNTVCYNRVNFRAGLHDRPFVIKPMTRFQRLTTFLDRHLTALLGAVLFVVAWLTYASTVPPVQVFGDPSEYTFIPWILGIAHPPGYAFYTLLASLWQHLLPIGSVAFRTHLLASTAGALSATLVYLIVLRLIQTYQQSAISNQKIGIQHLPALFAGLSLAAATDVWQHSIHTNAHIITLLLATTSVFLLIQWWSSDQDRWLYLFALIAGFSPPHHLLLVFAFPAYAIFIVLVKPRLFIQPKKILALIGCFALGLSVFLYYPLRSPSAPFGPTHHHVAAGLHRLRQRRGPARQSVSLRPQRSTHALPRLLRIAQVAVFDHRHSCWSFRASSGWRARPGNRWCCFGVLPVVVFLHHQHRAGCDGLPDAALHDDCGLQRHGRVGDLVNAWRPRWSLRKLRKSGRS